MEILSAALQGLESAGNKLDRTAARISRPDSLSSEPTGDQVDLNTEMVDLLSARNEYEANLKSLETGQEMFQHTLNILA
jgi:flagellar hook-associated protein FlgK